MVFGREEVGERVQESIGCGSSRLPHSGGGRGQAPLSLFKDHAERAAVGIGRERQAGGGDVAIASNCSVVFRTIGARQKRPRRVTWREKTFFIIK